MVVDDASPEDVESVVKKFSERDARFSYIRHGRNTGLAASRNTGLSTADEPLAQFLDADDMLTPRSLESRIDVLLKRGGTHEVAGVHGQVVQCTEETTLEEVATWEDSPTRPDVDWLRSEGESPFLVHAVLVRTEIVKAVGGFDESLLNGAEDWDLWQRILRHGFQFLGCPEVVGAYRQHLVSMIRAHSHVHLQRADELLQRADDWVAVDRGVAAGPANMPIAVAKNAFERALFAAGAAGQRVTVVGDVDTAIDGDTLRVVEPGTLVATRRDELVAAARDGIRRGLGRPRPRALSRFSPKSLRLRGVPDEIADRLMAEWAVIADP